jgi:BirA family biotin operon repressor/biotin-[acetyl-CoA-carboxylase] ligase
MAGAGWPGPGDGVELTDGGEVRDGAELTDGVELTDGAEPGDVPKRSTPRYGHPARPALRGDHLRRSLLGGLWRTLSVVEETGSTNRDLAAAAADGAAEGQVLVAEHQRAGRGRAGRIWSSPARAGLTVSVLLRPGRPRPAWPAAPATRWSWLPLLAGVALVESVRTTGLAPALKWPNDLLVGGRKCAGVLAEVTGDAVVIGIGLNVTTRADELPAPTAGGLPATSLALAGAGHADRESLLRALLVRVETWYGRWRAAAGDADACGLRPAYLDACATLGRPVRAALPGGAGLTGVATTVDPDGRLVLRTPDGQRRLAAGDITHLRPAG